MTENQKNQGKSTVARERKRAPVDAAGQPHARVATGARIVSLVPSLTELLFDLGLGANVVGRTAFCVHPADAVTAVTSVGGTKRVNMKRLLDLAPTHVVVNVDETPKALADELAGPGLAVVVTHPIAVEDNVGLYRLIGGIFDAELAAEDLVARFVAALSKARAAGRELPARRVYYLVWREPWITVSADTYISKLVATVNWHTVGHDARNRYPQPRLTDDFLAGVDLVLLSSEPYGFTAADAAEFAADFPAHGAKTRLVDGQMLSWYGSHAILGLQYLTDLARAEAARG